MLERVRYDLTDLSGVYVGTLGTPEYPAVVEQCTLEWSQYASIHNTGKMRLSGSIDFDHLRVCPIRSQWDYTTRTWTDYPRWQYLMGADARVVTREYRMVDGTPTLVEGESVEVSLYGLEYWYSTAQTAAPLDYGTGTRMLDAIDGLALNAGLHDMASTPSSAVTAAPWHYDGGTGFLKMMNDFAAAMNYWSVHISPEGQTVLAPYVEPRYRTPAFDFSPQGDWYKGEVKEKSDGWKVPNELTGVARQDGTGAPLVYTAHNYTRGRYSYANRQRWVGPESGAYQVDTQDMATLIAATERQLALLSNAPRTWEVNYLWQPFRGHEVGYLRHGDISTLTSLVKWTEVLHDVSAPGTATLEEVP